MIYRGVMDAQQNDAEDRRVRIKGYCRMYYDIYKIMWGLMHFFEGAETESHVRMKSALVKLDGIVKLFDIRY
jgi:hypothetical protein